jgi:hypothetical protein
VIDLTKEEPIGLRDAAKLKYLRRSGRPPHLATLYRWADRGVLGIRLETLKIGAARCTTEQAIIRFIERLSTGCSPSQQTPSERAKEIGEAEDLLRRDGI